MVNHVNIHLLADASNRTVLNDFNSVFFPRIFFVLNCSEFVHNRLWVFGRMDGIGIFNFDFGKLSVANWAGFDVGNRLGRRNFGYWRSRRNGGRWMAGRFCRSKEFAAADGCSANCTFSLDL